MSEKRNKDMNTKENRTDWIDIPDAPDIPGLKFRYFRGESDYPNIKSVFDACKEQDGFEYTMKLEEMPHHFENLINSDPYQDMIFVEVDGKPIAYSRVFWYEESSGDHIYGVLGFIRPEWRRKGIGTAIIKHDERRLYEIASRHPQDAHKYFQNDTTDARLDLEALLESLDYQRVRWGYEMVRTIDEPMPETPMPEGLVVRPVEVEHHRLIWEAENEAFRDHWGHSERTEEDYKRWITDPRFDSTHWKVAWDGDQVAGMVRNHIDKDENEEYGRLRGWTENISVGRPWRRRGLARSLLVQSIQMFKEMGFEETALGVDTQNANHALDLYQGVGYRIERRSTLWRKEMV
jgi:ribosomal protein S18 acetylase RimI-like enzyme